MVGGGGSEKKKEEQRQERECFDAFYFFIFSWEQERNAREKCPSEALFDFGRHCRQQRSVSRACWRKCLHVSLGEALRITARGVLGVRSPSRKNSSGSSSNSNSSNNSSNMLQHSKGCWEAMVSWLTGMFSTNTTTTGRSNFPETLKSRLYQRARLKLQRF